MPMLDADPRGLRRGGPRRRATSSRRGFDEETVRRVIRMVDATSTSAARARSASRSRRARSAATGACRSSTASANAQTSAAARSRRESRGSSGGRRRGDAGPACRAAGMAGRAQSLRTATSLGALGELVLSRSAREAAPGSRAIDPAVAKRRERAADLARRRPRSSRTAATQRQAAVVEFGRSRRRSRWASASVDQVSEAARPPDVGRPSEAGGLERPSAETAVESASASVRAGVSDRRRD